MNTSKIDDIYVWDDINTSINIIKTKYPYMLTVTDISLLKQINYTPHIWSRGVVTVSDLTMEMNEWADYSYTYMHYNGTLFIFFKNEDDAVKYALLFC